MSKTIEERASSTAQWILRREGFLKAADVDKVIQAELEEQLKIDKEAFDAFLCGLRNSNMWEGREWSFQRLWREFQESIKANELISNE